MKRIVAALIAVCLILAARPPGVNAAVEVNRTSSENPMAEVAKSTIYGGLAGLVLGGAIALANGHNEENIIKWSLVGGTFLGFGYGLYYVSSRPGPTAFLEVDDGRLRPGSLVPVVVAGDRVWVPVVSVRF